MLLVYFVFSLLHCAATARGLLLGFCSFGLFLGLCFSFLLALGLLLFFLLLAFNLFALLAVDFIENARVGSQFYVA